MATVHVNYEHKYIRCGKPRCHCATSDGHGPYWYAFWNDPRTGKKRAKYVGKNFTPPTQERPPVDADARQSAPASDEWDEYHTTQADRDAEREAREQHQARERARRERERAEKRARRQREREEKRERDKRRRREQERTTQQTQEEQARRRREQERAREAEEARRRREQEQARRPSREEQDARDAATLGVSPGVSESELKRAWRSKIAEAHPDRYQGAKRAQQEKIAKQINEAYQRMRKYRGWR